MWQNQCNGRGRRRQRSQEDAGGGRRKSNEDAGVSRRKGQDKAGGGRRKRFVNSSHQPLPLLRSSIGSNKQTSPKKVLLDHQFNWAVNQTGKSIAKQIGGIQENIRGLGELEEENWGYVGVSARQNRVRRSFPEHMEPVVGPIGHMRVSTRRQSRLKRSPRGPPYWLNPQNNLVVDDPPPPEVYVPQQYYLRFL